MPGLRAAPRQDLEGWLQRAERQAVWTNPREGKRVGVFWVVVAEEHGGEVREFRRVMRITERTIDRDGNALLVPQITVEGWWTSLEEVACPDETIIDLYCAHATSEQFHSEFKTDLDIERLPSGKFSTNDLVMACAVLAYNILRWIGLVGLLRDDAPIRHQAKQRRLRTVIQELMPGVDVRGCARRREWPSAGAEILKLLPGISELRGSLRPACRHMTSPVLHCLTSPLTWPREVRSLRALLPPNSAPATSAPPRDRPS